MAPKPRTETEVAIMLVQMYLIEENTASSLGAIDAMLNQYRNSPTLTRKFLKDRKATDNGDGTWSRPAVPSVWDTTSA
jgi:hypothetical protein